MRRWISDNVITIVFCVIAALMALMAAAAAREVHEFNRLEEECRAREGVPVITRGRETSFVCLHKSQAIDVQ